MYIVFFIVKKCFLKLCVYGICIDILLGFYCVCDIIYMGIICNICMYKKYFKIYLLVLDYIFFFNISI